MSSRNDTTSKIAVFIVGLPILLITYGWIKVGGLSDPNPSPRYVGYVLISLSLLMVGFPIYSILKKKLEDKDKTKEELEEEKTTGYQLKCLGCDYVWDTKYPRIPAKCPSCQSNIYKEDNYEVLTRYVKGACFIATASFGTQFENKINILRYWRDRFLLKYYFGEQFVKVYYSISPPIANFISKSKQLKFLTRICLIPLVRFLELIYKR